MDKGVKQRLLGGVVLVAGAILFLPYVFSGSGEGLPPRPEIPPTPQLASADTMAPRLEGQEAALGQAISDAHSEQDMVPAAPESSAPPQSAAASAPVPQPTLVPQAVPVQTPEPAPSPAPVVAKPAPKAVEKPAEKPVAKPRPEAQADTPAPATSAHETRATTADSLPEAWVVQVASLSTEDKAKELVARLHKKGYHAATHASGPYWKVIVGPELSRESAESLRQKLAADPALKLSGWVQSYHP